MALAFAKIKSALACLFGWCKRHKKITAAVLVLLMAAVAGLMYERDRRWQASFPFALQELNAAILTENVDVLAQRVDFITLSRHVAKAVMVNIDLGVVGPSGPQLPGVMRTDPAQLRAMEEAIQQRLFRLFTEKPAAETAPTAKPQPTKADEVPAEERGPLFDKAQDLLAQAELAEKNAEFKPERSPDPDALKEPPMFPANLLTQLQQKPFAIETLSENEAMVFTQVEHPQASMRVTLRLHAVNTPLGWRFDRLDGVGDMVRVYMAELRAFHVNREALFHARNAEILEHMNRTAKVLDCEALLASERPDGSTVMILRVNGLNSGEDTFTAASITCRLYNGPDNEVLKQNFGLTQTVKPGQNFRINYVQDYEATEPLSAILRREKKLACVAQVGSITLSNGRLLYVRSFLRFTESK